MFYMLVFNSYSYMIQLLLYRYFYDQMKKASTSFHVPEPRFPCVNQNGCVLVLSTVLFSVISFSVFLTKHQINQPADCFIHSQQASALKIRSFLCDLYSASYFSVSYYRFHATGIYVIELRMRAQRDEEKLTALSTQPTFIFEHESGYIYIFFFILPIPVNA